MNQLITNLSGLAKNKHVGLPLIAAGACEVAKVWAPHHLPQIEATQKILSYYAVLAAATSGPKPTDPNLS